MIGKEVKEFKDKHPVAYQVGTFGSMMGFCMASICTIDYALHRFIPNSVKSLAQKYAPDGYKEALKVVNENRQMIDSSPVAQSVNKNVFGPLAKIGPLFYGVMGLAALLLLVKNLYDRTQVGKKYQENLNMMKDIRSKEAAKV